MRALLGTIVLIVLIQSINNTHKLYSKIERDSDMELRTRFIRPILLVPAKEKQNRSRSFQIPVLASEVCHQAALAASLHAGCVS